MPRRNRVDPWGDLHAVNERGLFTGNRGCLVDDGGKVVRHHRGQLWIICRTEFKDWRAPLAEPGRWTPIFFLDDAVGLAAGHRPCGLCRRDAYSDYRYAVTRASRVSRPMSADDLNRLLAGQRHVRGRGLDRAPDRRLWSERIERLPSGTVIVAGDGAAKLVLDDRLLTFGFDGWHHPERRPSGDLVEVLTPPCSVSALWHGFAPVLHPTARA